MTESTINTNIIKLHLIKTSEDQKKYIVEEGSVEKARENKENLSTIHVGEGIREFSYLTPDCDIYLSQDTYSLFERDYDDFLDAVKTVTAYSVDRGENNTDSILSDAKKRIYRHSRTYPGLLSFIDTAEKYSGGWDLINDDPKAPYEQEVASSDNIIDYTAYEKAEDVTVISPDREDPLYEDYTKAEEAEYSEVVVNG